MTDSNKLPNSSGFSGLKSLTSDEEVSRATSDISDHDSSETKSSTDRESSIGSGSTGTEAPRATKSPYSWGVPKERPPYLKWGLWVGGILFVMWLFNSGSSKPSTPTKPIEQVPMAGSGITLNYSEIAYCLAEQIRLDAAEPRVNPYNSWEVSRYNGMIGDYNSRCAHYRYKQSAMDSAKRAVEFYRYQYQLEGQNRF